MLIPEVTTSQWLTNKGIQTVPPLPQREEVLWGFYHLEFSHEIELKLAFS